MTKRRSSGDGSVYQRERDGKWIATVELPRQADGKRRRKTMTGSTEREVRDKLKKAQRDLDAGRDLMTMDRPLSDLLANWLHDTVHPSDRSASTKTGHEINVRLHIIPAIGHVKLGRLKAEHVVHLHRAIAEKGRSARTQQSAHATLRGALQHAVKMEIIDRNVACLVSAPSPQIDRSKVHALHANVAADLIARTSGTRLHALWALLLTCGLRKGERLALRWSDIDLEGGVVRVERSMYRIPRGGLAFKPTKTANSTRSVPLAPITCDALRQHRARQREERLAAGPLWVNNDLVFSGPTGGPVDLKAPNVELRRVCVEMGIEPERVHNLRHTAATIAGDIAGGDLGAVSRYLGHSSIRVTVDMYRHTVPEKQRSIADGIGAALERKATSSGPPA